MYCYVYTYTIIKPTIIICSFLKIWFPNVRLVTFIIIIIIISAILNYIIVIVIHILLLYACRPGPRMIL